MNFTESLSFLDGRIRYGTRPGLSRIAAVLELLDHPQRTFPCVHITGTNGKYSTLVMTAAILGELGLTVGQYTSPHLETVRERMAIGSASIGEHEFAELLTYLEPYVHHVEEALGDHLSYFEILTAMAFEWFADKAVHAAVVEVGLGGEYDATNLVDAKVAVITNLGRDHLAEFGNDLARAAWEKAGIIKPGAFALTAVSQPELLDVIRRRAGELGAAALVQLGQDIAVQERRTAVGGQVLTVQGLHESYDEVFVPLFGAHQADNAALAIGAAEAFAGGRIDADGVRVALSTVALPGRLEVIARHPAVVLDGGHNAEAARSVVETLDTEFAYEQMTLVAGMLEDKPIAEALAPFVHRAVRFVLARPDSPRAAGTDRLRCELEALGVGPDRIIVRQAVPDAVRYAAESAGGEDLVLVFGSFTTAGEARAALRRRSR